MERLSPQNFNSPKLRLLKHRVAMERLKKPKEMGGVIYFNPTSSMGEEKKHRFKKDFTRNMVFSPPVKTKF